MKLNARQQRLLAMVRAEAGMRVSELVQALGVSEATVRRDLQVLAEYGLLRRVHGGAVEVEGGLPLPPPAEREQERLDDKRRIGAAAAARVKDGSTILLDAGSTTKQMVPYLSERRDLTVITRDLRLASLLTGNQRIHLVLLGGSVPYGSEAAVGGHTLTMLQHFYADQVFLGALGFSASGGLTTANAEEALVKTAMIERAATAIVLADSSKLGRRSGARVAAAASITTLITDAAAPADEITELQRQGVEVIQA